MVGPAGDRAVVGVGLDQIRRAAADGGEVGQGLVRAVAQESGAGRASAGNRRAGEGRHVAGIAGRPARAAVRIRLDPQRARAVHLDLERLAVRRAEEMRARQRAEVAVGLPEGVGERRGIDVPRQDRAVRDLAAGHRVRGQVRVGHRAVRDLPAGHRVGSQLGAPHAARADGLRHQRVADRRDPHVRGKLLRPVHAVVERHAQPHVGVREHLRRQRRHVRDVDVAQRHRVEPLGHRQRNRRAVRPVRLVLHLARRRVENHVGRTGISAAGVVHHDFRHGAAGDHRVRRRARAAAAAEPHRRRIHVARPAVGHRHRRHESARQIRRRRRLPRQFRAAVHERELKLARPVEIRPVHRHPALIVDQRRHLRPTCARPNRQAHEDPRPQRHPLHLQPS